MSLLFLTFVPGVAYSEDLVHLVRNPLNKCNKNEVKVMTEDMEEQVGHIRSEDAWFLSEALDRFTIKYRFSSGEFSFPPCFSTQR